ncbi:Pyridoxal phosphate homeostasis protein [Bosea sp. 62]|uniref:YggS family pyridoxal phosphate-dependent enzyme n=1 Tax=unclassified Bosea (in: a-proteobacteria) TaxID=2653178 RepID=UPI00125190C6|nr:MULTISPECIES: YggS family pyridoxal phosphate-dependent enzyme [unclassified Bosea (in: a-proteobacteria)]CAD5283343.1 Pyridoxal phosphate homeostasis protein [Bosea sp. 21B]CAD5286100.1 Pyridoxal phosphate homeostasis protein [Bosea sp. 46]CAD5301834.1 Pyridoxal phosphate homeostasis protein [Bosea sp. 7B]VVT51762.1 Pyridoxal phosphate homeostasis protein [Bosea sp. EC-HK365B]VXB17459.1 Pyridoxal phosphate homeostasis protein [Bosea sp. 62]
MSDVVARLQETRNAIARAARDFGRKPEAVTLIAVSKTKPAEMIVPVLGAGQIDFGENYVQEAKEKWPALRERFPQAKLHMIGPLQSNKARDAVALFDVIQSLDRESLAKELAREIERAGKAPQLIAQVNTGAEPQKGGVLPGEADAFLELCRTRYGLTIAGLMCIPPAEDPPSPHFALLGKIAERNGLAILSMGMSADYEAAIQLGATHVRVGSAIFGARG